MNKRIVSYLFLVLLLLSLLPIYSTPVNATLGYYGSGWTQRKTITIDHTRVNVNMPDFPMLFKNTSYDYRLHAQADGDDFVFTDNAGTKLSHEIESYNSSTGELVAWVKVPLISSTVNTVIYLYYGNASATNQEDTVNVWDSHYLGVWHMNEITGEVDDSTSNNHDLTTATATYTKTANTIGSARYFDAGADALKTTYTYPSMSAYTLECWYNHSSAAGGGADEMIDVPVNDPSIFRDASEKLQIYADGGFIGTSITIFNNKNWHWMSYGNTGAAMRLYVDTVRENNTAGAHNSANNVLCIGDNNVGTDSFLGYIDEARISDISRNWSYHNATYRNLNSPSTFYDVSVNPYEGALKVRLYIIAPDYGNNTLTAYPVGGTAWEGVNNSSLTDYVKSTTGMIDRGFFYLHDKPAYLTGGVIDGFTVTEILKTGALPGSQQHILVGPPSSPGIYLLNRFWTVGVNTWYNTTVYSNTSNITTSKWTWTELNNLILSLYSITSDSIYYVYFDVYYHPCPVNMTSLMYNATKVSLAWTKSNWGNTVITAKQGSTPTTWTDGTIVYNGSASTGTATGLIPAKHYYFKAWSFNTTNNMYSLYNTTSDCWTPPERITSSAYANTKVGANDYVNITWVNATGRHHTRTVIRKSLTAQPVIPTDGTGVYNGTGKPYFNETFALNYYTIFHYNGSVTDTSKYSIGSYVSAYCFLINCYNETSGVALTNWNITVTNATGSQIYIATGCSNPKIINVALMPSGDDCSLIFSKVHFTTRTYTQTIVKNSVYTINGYLSHFTTPTVPPVNTSYLYLLSVINEQNMPETGVTVSVKRIVSGAYVTVVSGNTDGNGQMSCYLVPGTFYKVLLNKTGFNDGLSDWTPSDALFTCTFKIYYTVPATEPTHDFIESIHISGSMNNATGLITVTYTDDLLNTTNLQIYIYDVTLNYTLVHTNSTVGWDSVTTTHTGNNTHDYQVVYKLNHTYFDYRAGFFLITGYHRTITTMTKMNLMFTINFGYNPFGWSNVITWFIIVGCFFSVERRDSYMAMFIAGFLLLFINYYIGFNTVMSFAAGGAIPVMMIVFGILMLIRDRARFSNDM